MVWASNLDVNLYFSGKNTMWGSAILGKEYGEIDLEGGKPEDFQNNRFTLHGDANTTLDIKSTGAFSSIRMCATGYSSVTVEGPMLLITETASSGNDRYPGIYAGNDNLGEVILKNGAIVHLADWSAEQSGLPKVSVTNFGRLYSTTGTVASGDAKKISATFNIPSYAFKTNATVPIKSTRLSLPTGIYIVNHEKVCVTK